MFRNLLKPDSGLMIMLTQVTDSIFLSLFWLLGCFPVVTIGASCAALYDAAFRGFRQGEKHSWQRFAYVFRENWKAGILPTLAFLVLFYLLGKGMILLWNAAALGKLSWGLFSAGALLGLLALGTLSLLFPLLSRFENTTAMQLKNTLLLGLANLPRTLGLGIVQGVAVYLCVRFVFPLFFLPALTALVDSFLVEPIFRPFLPEEPVTSPVEE